MAGGSALAAEMLNTEKVGHVQQKLMEIIEMSEAAYGCAVASATFGAETPSGCFLASTLYVNIGKILGIKAVYQSRASLRIPDLRDIVLVEPFSESLIEQAMKILRHKA